MGWRDGAGGRRATIARDPRREFHARLLNIHGLSCSGAGENRAGDVSRDESGRGARVGCVGGSTIWDVNEAMGQGMSGASCGV